VSKTAQVDKEIAELWSELEKNRNKRSAVKQYLGFFSKRSAKAATARFKKHGNTDFFEGDKEAFSLFIKLGTERQNIESRIAEKKAERKAINEGLLHPRAVTGNEVSVQKLRISAHAMKKFALKSGEELSDDTPSKIVSLFAQSRPVSIKPKRRALALINNRFRDAKYFRNLSTGWCFVTINDTIVTMHRNERRWLTSSLEAE